MTPILFVGLAVGGFLTGVATAIIVDQLRRPALAPPTSAPPPLTTQEKADALRARLMGKLNEAQQARLFEAEAALARFVQDYGPYAALALPLAAAPAITALDDWKP